MLLPLQALAAEGGVRAGAQVSEACRPLLSALSESLLSDLMAGLVQVALTRPQDSCQVCSTHNVCTQLMHAAHMAGGGGDTAVPGVTMVHSHMVRALLQPLMSPCVVPESCLLGGLAVGALQRAMSLLFCLA